MSSSLIIPRRRFLQLGLIGLVACSCPSSLMAATTRLTHKNKRSIALHNLHTGERLRTVYWEDGRYNRQALAKINKLMRDHRTGDIETMRPDLIELLHNLQNKLNPDAMLEIISGYRSPKSNKYLASKSSGVAKKSLHMKGMAADIRLPGIKLRTLQKEALSMQEGGVGFYGASNFVHVDVGRVRRWG